MPTIDHYVTPLKLPMTIDQFGRFPHLDAYKADFRSGQVEFTYQPRLRMARLQITPREPRAVAGITIAPLNPARMQEPLAKLFAGAFGRLPPMDTMAPTTRRHAADAAIQHTLSGADGRVIGSACFSAADSATGRLVGAAIVCEIKLTRDEWPDESMPDLLPNLTWLYVAPERQRGQIGSALLDHAVQELSARGVRWLVSHLSEGNATSLLFHWRQGFELVPVIAHRSLPALEG